MGGGLGGGRPSSAVGPRAAGVYERGRPASARDARPSSVAVHGVSPRAAAAIASGGSPFERRGLFEDKSGVSYGERTPFEVTLGVYREQARHVNHRPSNVLPSWTSPRGAHAPPVPNLGGAAAGSGVRPHSAPRRQRPPSGR